MLFSLKVIWRSSQFHIPAQLY